jgi:hypothetical protein
MDEVDVDGAILVSPYAPSNNHLMESPMPIQFETNVLVHWRALKWEIVLPQRAIN